MNELVNIDHLIYSKLVEVMSELDAIGKNNRNDFHKFMFRGIDDTYNALHPILSKVGIVIVPEVLEKTESIVMTQKNEQQMRVAMNVKYTFYAVDGSSVCCIVPSEATDKGDKATSKALSMAFKYAMFQVFCIPTEEAKYDDPDRESHDIADWGTKSPYKEAKPVDVDANVKEVLIKQIAPLIKDLPEDVKASYRSKYGIVSKLSDLTLENAKAFYKELTAPVVEEDVPDAVVQETPKGDTLQDILKEIKATLKKHGLNFEQWKKDKDIKAVAGLSIADAKALLAELSTLG